MSIPPSLPLSFALQDGAGFNKRWGYLTRAGLDDKSQLCRQIEKYADIYTSRVSNFLRYTPYVCECPWHLAPGTFTAPSMLLSAPSRKIISSLTPPGLVCLPACLPDLFPPLHAPRRLSLLLTEHRARPQPHALC
jgi:hypothetical protein